MILLTGAAGFIGSIVARKLNQQWRQDLMLVDRLRENEKWLNLQNVQFRDYIHADKLCDMPDSFWREIKQIIHLGACSSTTEKNVDFLMENNFNYSKSLWLKATQLGIPFIYASSAATYGDGHHGYDDDHKSCQVLRPLNPYGFSKHVFDLWALEEAKAKKAPPRWYGVKFFNVFGPNEYHKESMRSMVKKAAEQIKQDGRVKLFKSHRPDFKDGQQLRDFIYVMDAADVVVKLLAFEELPVSHNGLYNLGTGRARSFVDLVEATFRALNRPVNIEYIDMPLDIRHQYQYHTQANMKKLSNILPDQKFLSLEESIKDYVTQYLLGDEPKYF